MPIATTHIVMEYTDRPGIVAVYGREFGDAGINIAGMQIARREAGGEALSVLTVDSPVPGGRARPGARGDRGRRARRDRHHRE